MEVAAPVAEIGTFLEAAKPHIQEPSVARSKGLMSSVQVLLVWPVRGCISLLFSHLVLTELV